MTSNGWTEAALDFYEGLEVDSSSASLPLVEWRDSHVGAPEPE